MKAQACVRLANIQTCIIHKYKNWFYLLQPCFLIKKWKWRTKNIEYYYMEIPRPIELPIASFENEPSVCHESRMGKTHFLKTGVIFQYADFVCQAWVGSVSWYSLSILLQYADHKYLMKHYLIFYPMKLSKLYCKVI